MCMLLLFFSVFGEFQTPPVDLEYELKLAESFTLDPFGCKYSWNDAEEDGGKKDCYGIIVWTWTESATGSPLSFVFLPFIQNNKV